MKKLLLPFLGIIFIFTACVMSPSTSNSMRTTKTNDGPKNRKPGSCYAKCLITDLYEAYGNEFPVYTGTDTTAEFTSMQVLKINESSTKWVKRKGDRDCLSDDPNDCLVWCLVEVPPRTKTIQLVTDTTNCKDFEMQTILFERNARKGGYTEWKEVICANKVTSVFITEVQEALRTNDFDPGPDDSVLGARTKSALTKFQSDNKLPVGQLDFETLDALGVSY